MSGWREYSDCCRISAQDVEARRCGQCGAALLRCRGFDDCLAILAPREHCPVHVAPRLLVARGTRLSAQADEELDVAFLLENPEIARRPLRVRGLRKIEGQEAPEDVPLGWSSLRPGERREFVVRARRFEAGGRRLLTILFEVTVELGGRDESYAFEGRVPLEVAARDDREVNLTINAGENARITAMASGVDSGFKEPQTILDADLPVALQRADSHELVGNLRGYGADLLRVLPDVEVEWRGFAADHVPGRPLAQPFLHLDRIQCGRNARGFEPGAGQRANDVCLRIFDRAGGEVDRDASSRISGTHFDLFLQNDRLMLEVRSRNGCFVNDRRFEERDRLLLREGDQISPVDPASNSRLRLHVGFVRGDGELRILRFSRD